MASCACITGLAAAMQAMLCRLPHMRTAPRACTPANAHRLRMGARQAPGLHLHAGMQVLHVAQAGMGDGTCNCCSSQHPDGTPAAAACWRDDCTSGSSRSHLGVRLTQPGGRQPCRGAWRGSIGRRRLQAGARVGACQKVTPSAAAHDCPAGRLHAARAEDAERQSCTCA